MRFENQRYVPLTLRILLLTAYFPPDTGSAAHLFSDLGAALVERGHRVTVVTGLPSYHAEGPLEDYTGKAWMKETVNGIDVVRVSTLQLSRRLMVGRALWQFSAAAAFFSAGLMLPPHDVALVYSPPLPLGLAAWGLRRLRGVPFVLNVQDLFPQSIIDLGLLKNRWLIRAFEWIERFVYARAAHITVHSPGNRDPVVAKGVSPDCVTVVPNWVDTNHIRPGSRMNRFRHRHGLGDTFVVSFAGVLGFSQDLDVVLEAAAKLNGVTDIVWLIVGDGVDKPRLQDRARRLGPDNVRFLPMQPREDYQALLHASDVCLATLHRQVTTNVVPSKIVSIMAAGRPVVATLNVDGDAAEIIREARCGFAVPAGDAAALAEAILRLRQDPVLREEFGQNARRFAEANFSLQSVVTQYSDLLWSVSRQPGSGG